LRKQRGNRNRRKREKEHTKRKLAAAVLRWKIVLWIGERAEDGRNRTKKVAERWMLGESRKRKSAQELYIILIKLLHYSTCKKRKQKKNKKKRKKRKKRF
jgi:hypothetical protein